MPGYSALERRLAAILAADVVGYSRLMEQDEAGTLAALKERRRNILNPLVAHHHGRIVKVMGDGVLVEFASAVNAVQCAVELQKDMAAANSDLPEERRVHLRVGINLGDVMVEGGDLYGDGVNVAARLQQMAAPGGIFVSAKVHDEVGSKLPVSYADMGEQAIKNIAAPLRIFRVIGGQPELAHSDDGPPLPSKPSIAVLPFANMSGDQEQEYFADGIVEDITSGLARVQWLFVIARNSSFTYKGRVVDMKQIGRELGVRYLLEGSVRKAGDRIRITIQLVDATSGAHIWADRFDGTLNDVFDLQDRVTVSVVGAIEPRLRHAEIERTRKKPTQSVDAYDLFLRAVALHNTRRLEDSREALRLLHHAIEIDQHYASAYALAAYCVHRHKVHGWISLSDPMIAEGIRMARLAAERGQDDPEALWMSGLVISMTTGDFEDGLALIERSLTLNPNSANAWMGSGIVRAYLGDTETAIAHLQRSARLSPLDPLAFGTWMGFAYAHFMAGRYEDASTWCDRALHEAPNYPPALRMKAACHGLLGRPEEGRKWVRRLLAVNPDTSISSSRTFYEIVMKNPACLAAMLDGLRTSGMPE